MKKSWKLIPKILSGEKTIESRWYQHRRAPWGRIQVGDTVYFKNSGEIVTAYATVSKVLLLPITDFAHIQTIISEYGRDICLVNKDPATWGELPKYCILVFLKNPRRIKVPFSIDKKGFGSASAWITVENIATLKRVRNWGHGKVL